MEMGGEGRQGKTEGDEQDASKASQAPVSPVVGRRWKGGDGEGEEMARMTLKRLRLRRSGKTSEPGKVKSPEVTVDSRRRDSDAPLSLSPAFRFTRQSPAKDGLRVGWLAGDRQLTMHPTVRSGSRPGG